MHLRSLEEHRPTTSVNSDPQLFYGPARIISGNVTFTVDMRRALETLKARTDAMTYVESLRDEAKLAKTNPECKIQGLPHAVVGAVYLYPLDSADTKRTWKLEKQGADPSDQEGKCVPQNDAVSSLRKKECMVNGFTLKSDGTLMGYPVAAGVTAIRAQVKYPDGEIGECRFSVDVEQSGSKQKQARVRFAMQVLEAAISPDIVLDDRWFRALSDGAQAVLFPEVQDTTTAYTPLSNSGRRKTGGPESRSPPRLFRPLEWEMRKRKADTGKMQASGCFRLPTRATEDLGGEMMPCTFFAYFPHIDVGHTLIVLGGTSA
jgi:hypothetical protein